MSNEKYWEVVYQIVGDPSDFFLNRGLDVQYFLDEYVDMPSSYFQEELDRLRSMENHQQRGREFNYFVGLLFQQLPNVEVRVSEDGNSGEIDVHLSALDAPDWVERLWGTHTIIENKWEKEPIQKGEINKFYAKAKEIPNCHVAYFASMSGFSRGGGKETGALSILRNCEGPRIVDFWKDDIEAMAGDGTPEQLLRDRLIG